MPRKQRLRKEDVNAFIDTFGHLETEAKQEEDFDADFETPDVKRPASPGMTRDENEPRKRLRENNEIMDPEEFIGMRNIQQEKQSLLNSPDNANMEQPMQTQRSMETTVSGSNKRSRETAVDPPTRIERGILTETRTAQLPFTAYVSFNMLNHEQPVTLTIRMNHPFNIFKDTSLQPQYVKTDATLITPRARGLSNDSARRMTNLSYTGWPTPSAITHSSHNERENIAYLIPFPHTLVGSEAATNTGANRHSSWSSIPHANARCGFEYWYATLYQYMTTLSCDYKITFINGQQDEIYDNVVIFETDNVYGSTQARTDGCFPTNHHLDTAMKHKNCKIHKLSSTAIRGGPAGAGERVIAGKWVPNQFKYDVLNNDDYQTWIPTTAPTTAPAVAPGQFNEMPTGKQIYEQKTFLAYEDEHCGNRNTCINARIDLLYTVQFKDLRRQARYPTPGDANGLALNTSWGCQTINKERIGHATQFAGYTHLLPAPAS